MAIRFLYSIAILLALTNPKEHIMNASPPLLTFIHGAGQPLTRSRLCYVSARGFPSSHACLRDGL